MQSVLSLLGFQTENRPLYGDSDLLRLVIESFQEQYSLRKDLITTTNNFVINKIWDEPMETVLEKGQQLCDKYSDSEKHYKILLQRIADAKGVCSKDTNASTHPQCLRYIEWSKKTREIIKESHMETSKLNFYWIPSQTFYGRAVYYTRSMYESFNTKK